MAGFVVDDVVAAVVFVRAQTVAAVEFVVDVAVVVVEKDGFVVDKIENQRKSAYPSTNPFSVERSGPP